VRREKLAERQSRPLEVKMRRVPSCVIMTEARISRDVFSREDLVMFE